MALSYLGAFLQIYFSRIISSFTLLYSYLETEVLVLAKAEIFFSAAYNFTFNSLAAFYFSLIFAVARNTSDSAVEILSSASSTMVS